MSSLPVLLELHDQVAHVLLNRPEKLNAVTADSLRLIQDYVREIQANPSIRAVIIRGAGRAFCAGADLGEVGGLTTDEAAFNSFLDLWHSAYDGVAELPVPTIAAVHGAALAGGFELTHVCDFVVLGEGVPFGDQHANYGFYAGGGGTQRLARLIGERRAKWLLMSGELIDPHEAQALGLVNDVVPAGMVLDRATELARILAARSPELNAELKRTIRVGAELSLGAALAQERPYVLAHMTSQDAAAGLSAFRERSVPSFPDRRIAT